MQSELKDDGTALRASEIAAWWTGYAAALLNILETYNAKQGTVEDLKQLAGTALSDSREWTAKKKARWAGEKSGS